MKIYKAKNGAIEVFNVTKETAKQYKAKLDGGRSWHYEQTIRKDHPSVFADIGEAIAHAEQQNENAHEAAERNMDNVMSRKRELAKFKADKLK